MALHLAKREMSECLTAQIRPLLEEMENRQQSPFQCRRQHRLRVYMMAVLQLPDRATAVGAAIIQSLATREN